MSPPKLYLFVLSIVWMKEVFGSECNQRTYHVSGHREIRLFNEKVTYEQAIEKCQIWGQKWHSGYTGKLASIRNAKDQQCVKEMISIATNFREADWNGASSYDPGYYAGANDLYAEGRWFWQDGKPVNGYTNWAQNEPNNAARHGEDCMQLLMRNRLLSDDEVGKWVDVQCNKKLFYICERELDPSLNWGYENNFHALTPDRWREVFPACSDSNQSPINVVTTTTIPNCDSSHRHVRGWIARSWTRWIVENTGRFIKITVSPPNSMYTTFARSTEKFYIDHLILKWGDVGSLGSEHAINGNRHTGELQVFHKRGASSGILHAFAFLLQERQSTNNQKWDNLIESINNVQETGLTESIPANSGSLRHLLRDSLYPDLREHHILKNVVRYSGSVPHPPCTEDVLWTVFTNPIKLSSFQFGKLRATHSEDRTSSLSNNFRPLQRNNQPLCTIE